MTYQYVRCVYTSTSELVASLHKRLYFSRILKGIGSNESGNALSASLGPNLLLSQIIYYFSVPNTTGGGPVGREATGATYDTRLILTLDSHSRFSLSILTLYYYYICQYRAL